ncbi:MAG: cytochrome c oxidase subunit 3 [Deltaproteobacteria bacterium]|nr:cytochrome c oxidase subunit 3 [Deltaproteobacteria bacterium]
MSALTNDMRTATGVITRSNTGIPSSRLAMWFLLGGEVLIFGGLLVSYMMGRLAHPEWAEEAHHTATTIGFINAIILLTSDLFVVMAHADAQRKDGASAAKNIMITVALGLAFLVIKGFEYSHEISAGLTIHKSVFWAYYYLITGIHGSHIVVGIIALTLVARTAKRGEQLQRVETAGIYWHFVDMVWLIVFPLLYIAK